MLLAINELETRKVLDGPRRLRTAQSGQCALTDIHAGTDVKIGRISVKLFIKHSTVSYACDSIGPHNWKAIDNNTINSATRSFLTCPRSLHWTKTNLIYRSQAVRARTIFAQLDAPVCRALTTSPDHRLPYAKLNTEMFYLGIVASDSYECRVHFPHTFVRNQFASHKQNVSDLWWTPHTIATRAFYPWYDQCARLFPLCAMLWVLCGKLVHCKRFFTPTVCSIQGRRPPTGTKRVGNLPSRLWMSFMDTCEALRLLKLAPSWATHMRAQLVTSEYFLL